MEENKEKVPKFLVFILCICIVFIIIIAISFAVFINRQEKVIEKSENGANVVLNYSTDINGLKITKATPTTDQVGIKNLEDGEYFDFSVETKLDNAPSLDYEISIVKDKVDSNISDSDIRIYLEKEKSGTFTKVFGPNKYTPLKKKNKYGTEAGSMVLVDTKKTNSSVDNYRLRIWLSDTSVTTEGNYSVKVVVKALAK